MAASHLALTHIDVLVLEGAMRRGYRSDVKRRVVALSTLCHYSIRSYMRQSDGQVEWIE
jgi:hypothetical protein